MSQTPEISIVKDYSNSPTKQSMTVSGYSGAYATWQTLIFKSSLQRQKVKASQEQVTARQDLSLLRKMLQEASSS